MNASNPLMAREFYGFGRYWVDVKNCALWCGPELVPLTDREFDVLQAILRGLGAPVAANEILEEVFPKKGSEHDLNNVAQQVSNLRGKLGRDGSNQWYIRNVPKQGYYIPGAKVLPGPPASPGEHPSGPEAGAQGRRLARTAPVRKPELTITGEACGEPQHSDGIGSPYPPQPPGKPRFRTLGLAALAAATLAGLLSMAWRLWPTEMELQSCRQLTRDGRPKDTPVSDGTLVYFNEFVGNKSVIASVPVGGGNVTQLNLPLTSPRLVSVSPVRHSLLIVDPATHQLFEADIGSLALRPVTLTQGFDVGFATWDPAGRRLAATAEDGVLVFDPSRASQPLRLPFSDSSLAAWDPQGRRLRFGIVDEKSDTSGWWELTGNERAARPRPPFSANPREMSGTWTGGGRFFVFQAGPREREQIWVADEQSVPAKSYPLTVDARIWGTPAPLPGANTVLALGRQAQAQLVALSGAEQGGGIKPLIPVPSAYELEYSPDGHRVAYTLFPEHTIWSARADGSDPRPLTPSSLEAHQPHWSPDGTRIAFMGSADKQSRIYLVSSAGGALDKPLPDWGDQGVPTWSHDGRSLVFGDLHTPTGFERAAIHELDLQTGTVSTIAAPTGMWTPRMAPDGKHLVAVSYDSKLLYVRDNAKESWGRCVTMAWVGEPVWSRDSSSIQFLAKSAPEDGGELVFRVSLACEPPRLIADLPTYDHAGAAWTGIGLDGSPLALLRLHEESTPSTGGFGAGPREGVPVICRPKQIVLTSSNSCFPRPSSA